MIGNFNRPAESLPIGGQSFSITWSESRLGERSGHFWRLSTKLGNRSLFKSACMIDLYSFFFQISGRKLDSRPALNASNSAHCSAQRIAQHRALLKASIISYTRLVSIAEIFIREHFKKNLQTTSAFECRDRLQRLSAL